MSERKASAGGRHVLGRRAVAVCVALVALLLIPASSDAHYNAKKAIWGPPRVNGVSQFPIYRRLGVAIYQMQLNWASVAPTRPAKPTDPRDPAYRWPSDVGYALSQARRHRMRVLLQVSGSPPWANGGHGEAGWAPRRPSVYAQFVRAAARRYRRVHLWMVWGEPNRAATFRPEPEAVRRRSLTKSQARWPRRYARMLDDAYGVLKGVSKRNVVIGGNTPTVGDISPRLWIRNLRLPGGRPPRLDWYGHNPFTARRPDLRRPPLSRDEYDFSDLRRLYSVVHDNLARRRHQRIRLFLSEWTVPTAPGDREFNFYVDPPVQARWIRDGFRIVNHWSGIAGLGWIHVFDDPPGGDSTGGLLDFQGHRKPGYYAFRAG
jgi:hypothetical protein